MYVHTLEPCRWNLVLQEALSGNWLKDHTAISLTQTSHYLLCMSSDGTSTTPDYCGCLIITLLMETSTTCMICCCSPYNCRTTVGPAVSNSFLLDTGYARTLAQQELVSQEASCSYSLETHYCRYRFRRSRKAAGSENLPMIVVLERSVPDL